MEQLFFELIRVALGSQDTLSRAPSSKEWKQLYDMSKKQSLVGIPFAGLQKLFNLDHQEPSTNNPQPDSTHNPEPITQNLNEDLYYKWMGMSAKIQHRNDVVNRQCVELQRRLREDGFRSCILKGQGVAKWYKETLPTSLKGRSSDRDRKDDDTLCKSPLKGEDLIDLSKFRQSGDIDVWVEGTREEILAYINRICPTEEVGEMHAQFHVFKNTEVEVHFTPSILSNKKANKRLQEWFEGMKDRCFGNENDNENENHNKNYNYNENYNENEGAFGNENSLSSTKNQEPITHNQEPITKNPAPTAGAEGLIVPSIEFNLVFLLLHIFRHYLYEGVGMRQLMDYYFVLRHSDVSQREEAMKVLCDLKVDSFAGALMDVLHTIFGLEEEYMLCTPDKKRGKRLLDIVLEGGNFGHSTEKYKITGWDKPLSRLSRYLRRNWYMVWDYPGEIFGNVLKKIR